MNKKPYSYVVLRYVHDPATSEFINIGIVMVCPQFGFVEMKANDSIQRLTAAFGSHNFCGSSYRKYINYIRSSVNAHKLVFKQLPFPENNIDAHGLISKLLGNDSAVVQASEQKGGITSEPEETLERLYDRFVARYLSGRSKDTRSDDDILRLFRCKFEDHGAWSFLHAHTVTSPFEEYRFEKTWQNESRHIYEAVSMDLKEPSSLRDKGRKWYAVLTQLADGPEPFKAHILLGRPTNPSMKVSRAFDQVVAQLGQLVDRGYVEIVEEKDAESFAMRTAEEIKEHIAHAGR